MITRLMVVAALMVGGSACTKDEHAEMGQENEKPAVEVITCPSGSELIGDAPPKGHIQICMKSDYVKEEKKAHPTSWFSYAVHQDQERHGVYREWHPKSQIVSEEGEYTNGKQTGRRTRWHDNGQKRNEGLYNADKKHGKWNKWHENGKNKSQGEYRDGKKTGAWTRWYDNEQTKDQGEYKDGKKNGIWTKWNRAGKLAGTNRWYNGSGLITSWSDTGNKRAEGWYTDGIKTGLWTGWHENGQLKYKGEFNNFEADLPGLKTGIWTLWYDNGQKEAEGDFKTGRLLGYWRNCWNKAGKEIPCDDETACGCAGSPFGDVAWLLFALPALRRRRRVERSRAKGAKS